MPENEKTAEANLSRTERNGLFGALRYRKLKKRAKQKGTGTWLKPEKQKNRNLAKTSKTKKTGTWAKPAEAGKIE